MKCSFTLRARVSCALVAPHWAAHEATDFVPRCVCDALMNELGLVTPLMDAFPPVSYEKGSSALLRNTNGAPIYLLRLSAELF